MSHFIILENDAGLLVAQVGSEESSEEAALRNAAVIIDAGPYRSMEDAYDAMLQVPDDERERSRLRE